MEPSKKQLEEENKLIDEALKTVLETEELSNETVKILDSQTNQMRGIHDKLGVFNENVNTSKKTIFGMKRRVITDRAITGTVTGIIIAAAAVIGIRILIN